VVRAKSKESSVSGLWWSSVVSGVETACQLCILFECQIESLWLLILNCVMSSVSESRIRIRSFHIRCLVVKCQLIETAELVTLSSLFQMSSQLFQMPTQQNQNQVDFNIGNSQLFLFILNRIIVLTCHLFQNVSD